MRQFRATQQRLKVAKLLLKIGQQYGHQTRIAECLGVSRSTLCRDVAGLMLRFWGGKEAEEGHR